MRERPSVKSSYRSSFVKNLKKRGLNPANSTSTLQPPCEVAVLTGSSRFQRGIKIVKTVWRGDISDVISTHPANTLFEAYWSLKGSYIPDPNGHT